MSTPPRPEEVTPLPLGDPPPGWDQMLAEMQGREPADEGEESGDQT